MPSIREHGGVGFCGILVVAGLAAANVAWSQEPVSFVARRDIPVGVRPVGAAVGRFDGDAHADLAVADGDLDGVWILSGRGDGTFAVADGALVVGTAPTAIVAGDFDGDGHDDFATANGGRSGGPEGPTLSVRLGRGDGSFDAMPDVPLPEGPRRLIAGDFDGDGRPDLLLGTLQFGFPSHSAVFLLRGRGDGTFDDGALLFQTDTAFGEIVVGDVDGDGVLDVVIGIEVPARTVDFDTQVVVLRGRGDGTFVAPVTIPLPDQAFPAGVADFDGDGRGDVAVLGRNGLSILSSPGDGAFRRVLTCLAVGSSTGFVTDLTGDGRPDVVVTSLDAVTTLVGSGGLAFQVTPESTSNGDMARDVVADFDEDGHADLVGLSQTVGTVSVLFGRGDGTFRDAPRVAGIAKAPQAMAVADFDGDGHADLATTSAFFGLGAVSILRGTGGGRFAPPVIVAGNGSDEQFNPGRVVAADVDGDGHPDLVVLDEPAEAVLVLLGQGDGTFRRGPVTQLLVGPVAIAVADVDGDGHPDLAAATTRSVEVLRGRGDGAFDAGQSIEVAEGVTSLVAADFDGDGREDLATSSSVHDLSGNALVQSVSVLLGRGDGTFVRAADVTVGSTPLSIAAGDFDGDHRNDLVTADEGADGVSVLLGHGDGTFATSQVDGIREPHVVRVADFDGDGHPDIAVGLFENTIAVLLGRGDGTFVPAPVRFGVAPGPRDLVVADLDGDGRPDMATLNEAADQTGLVTVVLNDTTVPAPARPSGADASPVPPGAAADGAGTTTSPTGPPPFGCGGRSRLATVACRLAALAVDARDGYADRVARAATQVDRAAQSCRAGDRRGARRHLGEAARRLRRPAPRGAFASPGRGAGDTALGLAREIVALRRQLRCPGDGLADPQRAAVAGAAGPRRKRRLARSRRSLRIFVRFRNTRDAMRG